MKTLKLLPLLFLSLSATGQVRTDVQSLTVYEYFMGGYSTHIGDTSSGQEITNITVVFGKDFITALAFHDTILVTGYPDWRQWVVRFKDGTENRKMMSLGDIKDVRQELDSLETILKE